MSMDQVDDIEAAEDLLAELGGILAQVMAPVTDGPIESQALGRVMPEQIDAFERVRLMILGMEPFPSLQRLHDRIEAWCRPTCGMDGEPHADLIDGSSTEGDCGCPCHDRPPAAVVDAALDAFRQPPEA